MKKVVGLFCLFPVFVFAGEKGGVAASNFEASGSYSDSDASRSVSANGTYRRGIAEYFGYGLAATARRSNGKSTYLDSNGANAGINLFARRFDLGEAGLRYNHSYTKFDSRYGDISHNSDQYSVFASYYIDDFTLGFSRLSAHPEAVEHINTWNISASAYLLENTKLTASASGMDAKDAYGLSAEHQPSFLNNAASISASYNRSPEDDSFSVSLSYFFGTRVPLQQRDRQYR